MKIEVVDVKGLRSTVEDITEFSFSQSVQAPCDALAVHFKSDIPIDEIVKVYAYENGEVFFYGYCDNQRTKRNKNGYEIYFYARSSACLLVDNEAKPFTYNCPGSNQLFYTFAKPFGFKNALPNIASEEKYAVWKGVSCYGAINQFLSLCTGQNVYVTPDNTLKLYEISDDIKSFNKYEILEIVQVINRSEPISEICYKKSSSDTDYNVHTKGKICDDLQINRVGYLNLSSLSRWQREFTILQRLEKSYEDYKQIEMKISGYVSEPLLQRFSFETDGIAFEDYVMTDKRYQYDEKGEITKLVLKKIMDVKEVTYVD